MLVEVANRVLTLQTCLIRMTSDGSPSDCPSLLSSSHLDTQSRNRIETAFRRYRFGRDSVNYTDKFLHWWLGLVVLTGVGGMHIGPTVTDTVSYIMLCGYMQRILHDLVLTIRALKFEWMEVFATSSGNPSLNMLTVEGLIQLLRNQAARDSLWTAINDRPHILFHANKFRTGFKTLAPWRHRLKHTTKDCDGTFSGSIEFAAALFMARLSVSSRTILRKS